MNVFTVVVTGSIVCSLAYAAHQGRPVSAQPDGAGNRSVEHEGLVPGQRSKGHTMAALGGGGECTIGEPLNWFTNVHVLPECSFVPLLYGGTGYRGFDCDGDGLSDLLVVIGRVDDAPCTEYDPNCVQMGDSQYRIRSYWGTGYESPGDDGIYPFAEEVGLYRYSFSRGDGAVSIIYQSVMSGTVLNLVACAVSPCDVPDMRYRIQAISVHDWDSDGDLDLILYVDWWTGDYSLQGRAAVLVENTVKADSPLAADINQDGVVDGKDLASVLAAWTP